MPSFVHPSLLFGLALAGVPVLIHLINMMRHRRVPWAAMEFLLLSQKKNRTWILFKQILLLLLRMAAIAALVLLVARPLVRNQLSKWLGGVRTHHVVLLDDSYSMSDRWAETSAIDEAKAVIQQIGAEAARQVQPQQFTLLRFSRARRVGRGTHPDLLQEPVDSEFVGRLREVLAKVRVSQTAAGPSEALEAIGQLLGTSDDEQRIVYLVSDFRVRQWEDPVELRRQLRRLNESHAAVILVNCVEESHPNLAIASLAAAEGTRAAGVPLFMEIGVRNHGTAVVRELAVQLEEDGRPRPAVRLEAIPPGQMVRQRFQVNFPTAGDHVVTARLEGDAVAADNVRACVVSLPAAVPVLLVDGDPKAGSAHYLSAALAPGSPVRTGISPRIEAPRFLSLNPLDEYRAIYLSDFERLDRSAIQALERYASAGGGVAIFVGPQCSAPFINRELYREGQGIFPLPLAAPAQLLVDRLQPAPDVSVTAHPVFRILSGQRNSFLSMVSVSRYFAAEKNWQPPADSTVRVIASLRNGAPLAVERRFGQGKVVVLLTTAAPDWNNWARDNPSFVVVVQELQAYLAARPGDAAERVVGTPLTLEFDPAQYRPQVRFVTPDRSAASLATIDAALNAGGKLSAVLNETDAAGTYEAQIVRTDGAGEVRRFAFNVDPSEGDLKALGGEQLASRLEGVHYEYAQAASFHYGSRELAGSDLSLYLLYFLVALLIGEQILAWSASYHPPARHPIPASGGAA